MTKENIYRFVQTWFDSLPSGVRGFILPNDNGFEVELIREDLMFYMHSIDKNAAAIRKVFDWDLEMATDGLYIRRQLREMLESLMRLP